MLRRALTGALLALALGPAAAGAATISKVDATTLRYQASAGIRDNIDVVVEATKIRFDLANSGTESIVSVGCDAPVGTTVRCNSLGITRVLVFLADGQDVFNSGIAPQALPFTVNGGTGVDVIAGSAGADVLRGNEDGDFFTGNGGADDIGGGPGLDSVSFRPNGAVRVSLDDQANDGQSGGTEHANVRSDVENVSGSEFGDVIVGSAAANELSGLAGNDVITGGGGIDRVALDEGDDVANVRDGLGERITCYDGDDTATGDDIDAFSACEHLALSGELVRDLDRDGISKPDDCNDADPAIRPGAPDAPDDGVDQDCNGVDATVADRDGDGVPRPFDCDDANPNAAPGKKERFGNKVDEDCSGRADPLQSITTPVRARFIAAPGGARITRLQVVRPRKGTRVQVRCKGGGCRFAKRSLRVRKGGGTVDLRKRFKLTRLGGSQVLEVRLLREDSIGRVTRFTGRGSAIPATRILCLNPGKKRPGRC
jgi:hypothetical protein